MAHELIRLAKDALVCGDARVVFVRVQDIQGELHLGQTLVEIYVRAIAMKSRSCRNDVMFCGLYSPFRAIN